MRHAVLIAVVGVLAVARTAHASPSARLVYARSPDAATCPDEVALRKAVAARVGYDPFFPWATQAVVVQVWRVSHGFAARVEAVDEHGLTLGTRELSSDGQSCDELFDAAALAISIALDATVAASSTPAPSASSLPGPPPPPPAEPGPPPPVPSSPDPPAPPFIEPLPPAPSDAAVNGARRPSKFWSVGADVMGGIGVAPSPNFGIEAFVARRVKALSLEVGLRADMSFPKMLFAGANTELGGVQSARFAVVVAPCAHLGLAYGCPQVQVGWFQAWMSSGAPNPQATGGALVAAGARLGLDLPVTPWFDIRVYADGVANLDRPVFVIDAAQAWEEPLFAAAVGIGVGSVIP
jgi:hypothetical protein